MKLLLDTHTLIWWSSDPNRLSATAMSCLRDRNNEVWLSLVSLWEIQIKQQLGKLAFTIPLDELVAEQQKRNGFNFLPISINHLLALNRLPLHHRDPFDRLLVAQAIEEGATLVSQDAILRQYPVVINW